VYHTVSLESELYPDTETVRRLHPGPKKSKGLKAKGSVNKKNGSLRGENSTKPKGSKKITCLYP